MKNSTKITIAIIIIAFIAYIAYLTKDTGIAPAPIVEQPVATNTTTESITGCYVATLGKDVYSLNIAAQQGASVYGTLVFKNFQKDSSSGTFKGTYKDGILLGDYSFNSEGMASVMQVIFKKQGTDFVRGYGAVTEDGTRFADLNAITYDQTAIFKASSSDCATALLGSTQGIVGIGETKTINTVGITLNSLAQDSRCPIDVICIESGAVTANVTLKSGSKSETFNMPSDEVPHVFAGYKISIVNVNPPRVSNQEPEKNSYKVTFNVVKA